MVLGAVEVSSLNRFFHKYSQNGQGRRRDSRDPGGLAQGFGPRAGELLHHLPGEARDPGKIQVPGDARGFGPGKMLHFLFLPLDVTGVFQLDLDRFPEPGFESGQFRLEPGQVNK